MRYGSCVRKTGETDISVEVNLDGSGKRDIATGLPFFDHMLDLMAAHGYMDLSLHCKGDTEIDAHHSMEDCGLALGAAFKQAIGDKKGIRRYASCHLPMDEALVLVALDWSNRPYLHYEVDISPGALAGSLDAQLFEEFFRALAQEAGLTLHICQLHGRNIHHILEAVCKGFGRALADASQVDQRAAGTLPSTKGKL